MSDNFDVYAWKRNRLLESLTEDSGEKEYEVQYWVYRNDDYDNDEVTVKASSEEEALEKAKEEAYKGKKFKVIAIDGKYINENTDTLSPIEETINFVIENIEGYSDYFPGGKTKGLDKDTLSTILMQIIKDTEEDGKQLDESNLCKRGRNYLAARKRAGEKSSAYLSGRAVKVCKGQIKGSDGKKKKSY